MGVKLYLQPTFVSITLPTLISLTFPFSPGSKRGAVLREPRPAHVRVARADIGRDGRGHGQPARHDRAGLRGTAAQAARVFAAAVGYCAGGMCQIFYFISPLGHS